MNEEVEHVAGLVEDDLLHEVAEEVVNVVLLQIVLDLLVVVDLLLAVHVRSYK